jgi:hypothetical protein
MVARAGVAAKFGSCHEAKSAAFMTIEHAEFRLADA